MQGRTPGVHESRHDIQDSAAFPRLRIYTRLLGKAAQVSSICSRNHWSAEGFCHLDVLDQATFMGAVTVPGTLSVERWDFPPSGGTNVGIGASSYLIGLNDGLGGQALSKPATITFHFDPVQLRKDVAASEAVWVVYWDGAKRRQVEEPCTVDATNGTVTVSTNHFSQWWLYLLGPGDAYATSPHFTFRFPAAINISAWGTNDPFEVMARVRSKLEAFHDAYVAAGFGAPSWKVPVYLSESDEAGYGPLTGNVNLTSRIYSSDMKSEYRNIPSTCPW